MDGASDEIRAINTLERIWKFDILAIDCLDAVIDDDARFEFLDWPRRCSDGRRKYDSDIAGKGGVRRVLVARRLGA